MQLPVAQLEPRSAWGAPLKSGCMKAWAAPSCLYLALRQLLGTELWKRRLPWAPSAPKTNLLPQQD